MPRPWRWLAPAAGFGSPQSACDSDQPVGAVVGEAEVQHPHEVHGGGAGSEPDPVLLLADVAEAPVVASHHPGDGALDHGALLPVGLLELWRRGELAGGA